MISLRKLAVVLLVGLLLTITLAAANRRAKTERIWKVLEGVASQTVLVSTNADFPAKNNWWFGDRNGSYEVGQVTLKDGSAWQFAFASHHVLERPESFVVFKNGPRLIRAEGYGFCCELEFDDQKQPMDSVEFLRQLQVQLGFATSTRGFELE